MLIVMSGLPGTGKSTLATALATRTKKPHVSVDPIEVAMWTAGIERSETTGIAAYDVARSIADEQLRVGLDVIVDAVNAVEVARQMWRSLAVDHNTDLFFVECVMSNKALHRERLEGRQRPNGFFEPTWSEVEKRQAEFDPWTDERLVVDCAEPLELNVERVIQYVH